MKFVYNPDCQSYIYETEKKAYYLENIVWGWGQTIINEYQKPIEIPNTNKLMAIVEILEILEVNDVEKDPYDIRYEVIPLDDITFGK